jgi:actin-related protein 8
VIVIHPGSRFLRVGRATETTPLTVSNVIARKHNTPLPAATITSRLHRSPPDIENTGPATKSPGDDEYAVAPATEDPVSRQLVLQIDMPILFPGGCQDNVYCNVT